MKCRFYFIVRDSNTIFDPERVAAWKFCTAIAKHFTLYRPAVSITFISKLFSSFFSFPFSSCTIHEYKFLADQERVISKTAWISLFAKKKEVELWFWEY